MTRFFATKCNFRVRAFIFPAITDNCDSVIERKLVLFILVININYGIHAKLRVY